MRKIIFLLTIFAESLIAMDVAQLYRNIQQGIQKEKVKERYEYPRQLIGAVERNNAQDVARLLQKGINPDIRNDFGMQLLSYAIYHGYQEIVRLLIERGANVNGDENNIPLHMAVIANQSGILKLLLDLKADVNKQNRDGQTALMLAVEYNHPKIMQLLLIAGADKYLENKYHENAIDIARRRLNQKLIELLLGSTSLVF